METLLIAGAAGLLAALLAALVVSRWAGGEDHTPVLAEIRSRLDILGSALERVDSEVRGEFSRSREEAAIHSRALREEIATSLKNVTESTLTGVGQISRLQENQLGVFADRLNHLTSTLQGQSEATRSALERALVRMQTDNAEKLDQIRATVENKLDHTLEKRLGESFRLVSDRLEQVHRGLGEMQNLAVGVGDLKRVLTNVKVRGTMGEIQLGALLEQLLTTEQYALNVATNPASGERVEFALRLPGRDDTGQCVWMPLDAKFPTEDYQRLVEAQSAGDSAARREAVTALERRLLACARDIRDKYLHPPDTTDFAIMFLPTEGLYAEAISIPGLVERLQRDCRVVVAGPTTLAALLNSLQMGFRTLAIEKRGSEIWKLLGAIKRDFNRFGDLLEDVHKRLIKSAETIDGAMRKSRTIERRLKGVEELPAPEARLMLVGADDDEAVNN